MPISSPWVTSGTTSATPAARSCVERGRVELEPRQVHRARAPLEVGEQRVGLRDVHGDAGLLGRVRRRYGGAADGRRVRCGPADEAAEGASQAVIGAILLVARSDIVTKVGLRPCVRGRSRSQRPTAEPGRTAAAGRATRASMRRLSRSTSFRSRSAKASTVRLAVVAGPVEAPVHGALDAPRSGWNSAKATSVEAATASVFSLGDRGQHRLEDDDEAGEHGGEHRRHHGPADRAADDPVDVVQAVAQDRDAGAMTGMPAAAISARRNRASPWNASAAPRATMNDAVASRSHLICWRSTAEPPRNRTTSEPMQVMPRIAIAGK